MEEAIVSSFFIGLTSIYTVLPGRSMKSKCQGRSGALIRLTFSLDGSLDNRCVEPTVVRDGGNSLFGMRSSCTND